MTDGHGQAVERGEVGDGVPAEEELPQVDRVLQPREIGYDDPAQIQRRQRRHLGDGNRLALRLAQGELDPLPHDVVGDRDVFGPPRQSADPVSAS